MVESWFQNPSLFVVLSEFRKERRGHFSFLLATSMATELQVQHRRKRVFVPSIYSWWCRCPQRGKEHHLAIQRQEQAGILQHAKRHTSKCNIFPISSRTGLPTWAVELRCSESTLLLKGRPTSSLSPSRSLCLKAFLLNTRINSWAQYGSWVDNPKSRAA